MDSLVSALKKVRLRLSIQQWIDLVAEWLFFAVIISIVWLIAVRLFPVLGSPMPISLYVPAAGVAIATLISIIQCPKMLCAALEADRRLGLKERLTSSYELRYISGDMTDAVHRDARRALDRLDMSSHFAYHVPKAIKKPAIAVTVFYLALVFLPEFDLLNYREEVAKLLEQKKAIKLSATKLRSAVLPIKERSEVERAKLAELASEVERIAEDLENQAINEKQALARIEKIQERMLEQREQLLDNTGLKNVASDAAETGSQGDSMPMPGPLGSTPASLNRLAKESDIAKSMKEGKYDEAAKKIEELAKKISEGKMSDEEKKKVAEQLGKLSQAMGGQNTSLGSSLAQVAQQLGSMKPGMGMEGMAGLQASLSDVQSVMEQMEQLDSVNFELSQWAQGSLAAQGIGASNLGQGVGMGNTAGIGGNYQQGEGGQTGGGMGRRGTGRGGRTGDLPDVSTTFDPARLPGEMTKGKILAGMVQQAEPQEGAKSEIEYIDEALVQVQRDAEQALSKQEIPPGAREFVRQYFDTFDAQQ